MSAKQIVGVAIACFVIFITIVVALFSPLANGLFAPGNDTADDVIGLLLAILILSVIGILMVTFVIACCQLAKRLGHEQSAGLLLLIPLVNLVVFFLWAFTESPNEKRIARLKRTQKSTSARPLIDGAN
jgi:ATP/ADP translocase